MEYLEIINDFQPISIINMQSVMLMDRTDTKYVFHRDKLRSILKQAKDSYFIFKMAGNISRSYENTYYDTDDFKMYHDHHNGKLNRYKIRERIYSDTKEKFVEVKFKNNKRDTRKKRIKIEDEKNTEVLINNFVKNNSPYEFKQLKQVVSNVFSRITLVSKKMDERVTIDFNLEFQSESGMVKVPDLVIIEQKKSRFNKNTSLSDILLQERIFPMGFSKYCMGLVFTNNSLKYNRFKSKILYLNKYNIERKFF